MKYTCRDKFPEIAINNNNTNIMSKPFKIWHMHPINDETILQNGGTQRLLIAIASAIVGFIKTTVVNSLNVVGDNSFGLN